MSTEKHKKTYLKVNTVADGDYTTHDLIQGVGYTELADITFYDVAGNVVTPTAGTIKVTLSPNGQNFRTVENGEFEAINTLDETRTQPNAVGLASSGRITLTGIVGADRFTALFYQADV